jgi:hypothetical protein
MKTKVKKQYNYTIKDDQRRIHLLQPVFKLDRLQFYRDKTHKVIIPKGRWGFGWLHKLIYNAARNLGMLQNSTVEVFHDIVEYKEIKINEKKLLNSIKHINTITKNSHYQIDQLEILIGADQFNQLILERSSDRFIVPINLNWHEGEYDKLNQVESTYKYTINGIYARIVPWLSGIIVVPIETKLPKLQTQRQRMKVEYV